MAKGAGLVPNFDKIDEDEASSMLSTAAEVMRMIRDGDTYSDDERARSIYARLFTDDQS